MRRGGSPRWGGSLGALPPLLLETEPFLAGTSSGFFGGEGRNPKLVVDQRVLLTVDQVGVATLVGVDGYTGGRPI